MKNKELYVKIAATTILLLLLLIIMILIGYKNYSRYRDTIVRQQQEHLLTIAKSISRNTNEYLKENSDKLSLLAENPIITEALKNMESKEEYGFQEDLVQNIFEKNIDELESMFLISDNKEIIFHYPRDTYIRKTTIDDSIVNNVLANKKPYYTREYLSGPNKFSVDILYPVIINNEVKGILVSTISLNKLFDNLIKPIRSGEKGYVMVKNREGIIIMHPVKEQIGIESIKVRKEKFPKLDWSELEELNEKQLKDKEGYHIYSSRWWQEKEIKLFKKITAFTTLETENIAWIISVQMDYSEIEEPIKSSLMNIIAVTTIIMIFVIIVLYIIFRIDKERKALELETKYLKQLNETWDKLIKSEARLRHAQKLETIGLLTSGIAHEFNNLLSPIIGYSEILLDSITDNKDITEDLMEIKKSALRSQEITNQILDFSRKDTLTAKIKPIKVEDVIMDSIKLIKSIQPRNIKIELNIRCNGLIVADKTQMEQVLMNLYTNAYHAMGEKEGILEINADEVDITFKESGLYGLSEGKYVKIQVIDSGIGMDEEIASKIFDPFFTTKESGEGTGLGLSVVQGIIKEHNGSIIIKSKVNVGTTVNIYLPIFEGNNNEN